MSQEHRHLSIKAMYDYLDEEKANLDGRCTYVEITRELNEKFGFNFSANYYQTVCREFGIRSSHGLANKIKAADDKDLKNALSDLIEQTMDNKKAIDILIKKVRRLEGKGAIDVQKDPKLF